MQPPDSSGVTAFAASAVACSTDAAVVASPVQRERIRRDIAACFQSRAVQHLSQRVDRALGWAKAAVAEAGGAGLQGVVVAGGVAANKSVRGTFPPAPLKSVRDVESQRLLLARFVPGS